MMTWTSFVFLWGYYWPYLAVVALIGLMVGWRSFAPPAD